MKISKWKNWNKFMRETVWQTSSRRYLLVCWSVDSRIALYRRIVRNIHIQTWITTNPWKIINSVLFIAGNSENSRWKWKLNSVKDIFGRIAGHPQAPKYTCPVKCNSMKKAISLCSVELFVQNMYMCYIFIIPMLG